MHMKRLKKIVWGQCENGVGAERGYSDGREKKGTSTKWLALRVQKC